MKEKAQEAILEGLPDEVKDMLKVKSYMYVVPCMQLVTQYVVATLVSLTRHK